MSLTGNTNAEKIWNYLIAHNLTKEGAAGLMGNIYAESGLIPMNLQNAYEKKLGFTDATYTAAVDSGRYVNFVRDSAGYGLCQWTYWSRKEALLNFAKAAGKSIGDLEMQLDFMLKELASYPSLLNFLKMTHILREASDRVLTEYERPADQSSAMKAKRASYGENYLRQFGTESGEVAEVGAAIDKLAKLGVINSPDYWKAHHGDVRFVDVLLKKAAAVITRAGTRCASVEAGVNALVASGVITTPDYWKKQTGTVGELLKALGGAVAPQTGITEAQLRQRVCDIIGGWVGATKGSTTHYEILNIYNGHKPLARGYAVKPNDAYCATTASAAYIEAGISEFTGTECSCFYFVEEAKKRGIWTENDAYTPKLGDAVLYDWQDSGAGDNTGTPDHIGIVTSVSLASGTFTVTEGNMNGGKVGRRTMYLNGKYIRGFITPDFAAIAKKLSA